MQLAPQTKIIFLKRFSIEALINSRAMHQSRGKFGNVTTNGPGAFPKRNVVNSELNPGDESECKSDRKSF